MDFQRLKYFLIFSGILLAACVARPAEKESIRDNIWLLQDSDFTDAQTLAMKLAEKSDTVSEYLRDNFSEAGENYLADYDGSMPPGADMREVIIADLNRIITDSDWYREQIFEKAELSGVAYALIGQKPEGYERMHLNRMLLEEIYSNEIAGRPERYWLLRPSDLTTDK